MTSVDNHGFDYADFTTRNIGFISAADQQLERGLRPIEP